ncbi:MAG: non-heme iron oxygenase ferredoxin subunit [Actinomycetota bacterium]|nr:non-heme iron oxygenase ferredoxin subunit [Actinomycetota bacterium]
MDEIPDGGMKQVVVDGELVGIYRVGADLYAIHDICTHEETYLTEGDFDPDDLEVECPLHGSRFNVETGEVRILPATRPVATYDVKIEGDLVLVGPRTSA